MLCYAMLCELEEVKKKRHSMQYHTHTVFPPNA